MLTGSKASETAEESCTTVPWIRFKWPNKIEADDTSNISEIEIVKLATSLQKRLAQLAF